MVFKNTIVIALSVLAFCTSAFAQEDEIVKPSMACPSGPAVYEVKGGLLSMSSYRTMAIIDRSRVSGPGSAIDKTKLVQNYEIHKCEVSKMDASSSDRVILNTVSENFEQLIPMYISGQITDAQMGILYANAKAATELK
jgi:hypothetical protein